MAPKRTDVPAEAAQPTVEASKPLSKAEVMKRKLEAQPKIPIMIPLAPGETEGSTQSVILNGYRMNIRKGMYVHVPQQVAEVIMESQQQTRQAIENYFAMDANGVSPAMRSKSVTS